MNRCFGMALIVFGIVLSQGCGDDSVNDSVGTDSELRSLRDRGVGQVRDAGSTWICTEDSNCPINQICREGVCVVMDEGPSCSDEIPCPDGTECIDGECAMLASGCMMDSECAAGQVCVDGECIQASGCQTDQDCDLDQVCTAGECVRGGCIRPVDCGPGQDCVMGECQPIDDACSQDDECAAGQRCEDGQCVEPTPECQNNADCPAELDCIDGRCQPRQVGGNECVAVLEPGGLACLSGGSCYHLAAAIAMLGGGCADGAPVAICPAGWIGRCVIPNLMDMYFYEGAPDVQLAAQECAAVGQWSECISN